MDVPVKAVFQLALERAVAAGELWLLATLVPPVPVQSLPVHVTVATRWAEV